MSHFYSSCQGGRGKATRCGHKTTGVQTLARCHELTVSVVAQHDHVTNTDTFDVHLMIDDDRVIICKDGTDASQRIVNIQPVSASPLRIVYEGDTHIARIRHNVAKDETHNVRVAQANFFHELDADPDEVPF